MNEVSVYMFLGFLESGKTKFIQETLEDARMDTSERTVLLVCEEGVEEYVPERFAVKNVVVVTLEDESELTLENLGRITEKYRAQRIIVEYNGMWELNRFFEAMPESWVINQMMTFFDAASFSVYNRNMRQLVFDKINMTQMVVFNRFSRDCDKTEYHKAVRAISRRPDIVYDYPDGAPEFDDIEDPLPFDKQAAVIEIEDRDFAWFYRDIAENMPDYIGKTVSFKGMAALSRKAPVGSIVLGRHIMTCCEADIAYDGFVVKTGKLLKGIKTRDWIKVTAKIALEYSAVYQAEGPVLTATRAEWAEPPEEPVATYY